MYAPKAYERDALYIFTPEFMRLLVEEGKNYDVETVGDTLYVYSDRAFVFDHKVEYETIANIIRTIGAKTISRTDLFVDERVGEANNGEIADGGQRLKRNWILPTVSTIITLLVAAAVFYLESLN